MRSILSYKLFIDGMMTRWHDTFYSSLLISLKLNIFWIIFLTIFENSLTSSSKIIMNFLNSINRRETEKHYHRILNSYFPFQNVKIFKWIKLRICDSATVPQCQTGSWSPETSVRVRLIPLQTFSLNESSQNASRVVGSHLCLPPLCRG